MDGGWSNGVGSVKSPVVMLRASTGPARRGRSTDLGLQRPAPVNHVPGLADYALDQQHLFHRPADRVDLAAAEPITAIIDGDVRLRRGAERQRRAAFDEMAHQPS